MEHPSEPQRSNPESSLQPRTGPVSRISWAVQQLFKYCTKAALSGAPANLSLKPWEGVSIPAEVPSEFRDRLADVNGFPALLVDADTLRVLGEAIKAGNRFERLERIRNVQMNHDEDEYQHFYRKRNELVMKLREIENLIEQHQANPEACPVSEREREDLIDQVEWYDAESKKLLDRTEKAKAFVRTHSNAMFMLQREAWNAIESRLRGSRLLHPEKRFQPEVDHTMTLLYGMFTETLPNAPYRMKPDRNGAKTDHEDLPEQQHPAELEEFALRYWNVRVARENFDHIKDVIDNQSDRYLADELVGAEIPGIQERGRRNWLWKRRLTRDLIDAEEAYREAKRTMRNLGHSICSLDSTHISDNATASKVSEDESLLIRVGTKLDGPVNTWRHKIGPLEELQEVEDPPSTRTRSLCSSEALDNAKGGESYTQLNNYLAKDYAAQGRAFEREIERRNRAYFDSRARVARSNGSGKGSPDRRPGSRTRPTSKQALLGSGRGDYPQGPAASTHLNFKKKHPHRMRAFSSNGSARR